MGQKSKGIPPAKTNDSATMTNEQRMYAMPSFADDLTPQEMADLISWARAEWGGQGKPVTAEQVEKLKKAAQ